MAEAVLTNECARTNVGIPELNQGLQVDGVSRTKLGFAELNYSGFSIINMAEADLTQDCALDLVGVSRTKLGVLSSKHGRGRLD